MDNFERYHLERPEGGQGEANGLPDTSEFDTVDQTLFCLLIGISQALRRRECVFCTNCLVG